MDAALVLRPRVDELELKLLGQGGAQIRREQTERVGPEVLDRLPVQGEASLAPTRPDEM